MFQMLRPRASAPPLTLAAAATPPKDPLESPLWESIVERYLADYPIVFDDAVKVLLPPVTEDQTQVPIGVDARSFGKVDELVLIGELNPFPLTIRMRPARARAFAELRMRIEQGTVIRAAVRKDGQWHVGGRYLDAAGGGCSAPPVSEAKVDWSQIGKMRGRVWRESDDTLRLRLRIVHPMDTGLHKEPAFFIESLKFADADGRLLADFDVKEPVASNPTFTFLVDDPKVGDHISVAVHDNDGNDYKAKVPLPSKAASIGTFREGRL